MFNQEKLNTLLSHITVPLPWHEFLWKRLYTHLSQDRLPHTLLLQAGTRLVSQQFATAFAQLVLCQVPIIDPEKNIYLSCHACHTCQLFLAGTHPNYYFLGETKESSGERHRLITMTHVRSLITALLKTPSTTTPHAYHTVILIEAFESLNPMTSNALLKILEEPSPGILFLITTIYPKKLLQTIQSRCQLLHLLNPTLQEAKQWLTAQTTTYSLKITDTFALKVALDLSENDPMVALQHVADGSFNIYRLLLQSLIAMQCKSVNPGQIAERWNQYPIDTVLYYFIYLIYQLIRWQLGIDAIDCGKDIVHEEVKTLLQQKDIFFLFTYLDTLQAMQHMITLYTLNTLICFEHLAYCFIS